MSFWKGDVTEGSFSHILLEEAKLRAVKQRQKALEDAKRRPVRIGPIAQIHPAPPEETVQPSTEASESFKDRVLRAATGIKEIALLPQALIAELREEHDMGTAEYLEYQSQEG